MIAKKSARAQGRRRARSVLLLVASALLAPLASAQVSVTTYHNNISRGGANLQETLLYPANVNSGQFGKLFTVPVDGYVYAEPLYMANLAIAGGTHNVVYVATEHDSVYAIDADSGVVYWQTSLIASGGRTLNGQTDIAEGCEDTVPEVGITGTPVIDPATNTLYVVAKSVVGGLAVQYLHAIDLASAAEKFGSPVRIQAAVAGAGYDSKFSIVTFDPLHENQRPALLLENGHLIIGWGSHCDVDPWHGWIMSYSARTLTQEAAYNSTPNGSEGGIWMSGGGPAADASGNLYFSTGNGDWNGATDFGDSVVKLGPPANGAFPLLDYFTPFDQASLATGDVDVASGSPILLPPLPSGVQLVAQVGKVGTMYVLNANNMGKYCVANSPPCTAGDPQIVEEIPNATTGVWGAPAYWNGSLYWGGANDRLAAFAFNTKTGAIATAPTSQTPQFFAYPAPTPSISANGASAGILWGLDASAYASTCAGGTNCQVLYAYDATNLGTLLYSSNQAANFRDVPGSAVKFATPTIANGKVYVGSQYAISAYGALPNVKQTTIAPVLSPAPGTFTSAQSVTITDAAAGAIIYYTTDGTAPTTASPVYTGPISLTTTLPILAVAIANGGAPSASAGGTYLINSALSTAPQPVDLSATFNISGISAVQSNGAPILDGGLDGYGDSFSANLTGTSVVWSGVTYSLGLAGEFSGATNTTIPIPSGTYTTVKVLAAAVNGNQPKQIFSLNYADGTWTNFTQSLSDWCTPQSYPGESIVLKMPYRVTASGQTQSQTVYLYGYSFAVPAGETVKSLTLPATRDVVVLAVEVTPNGQPTSAATANPAFSPIQGTYTAAQNVALSDPTPGAIIYYTLDGSTPTLSSTQYTSPIPIAVTTTISALATASGYPNSMMSAATYTITPPGATAPPSFSPPPGTFTSAQTVTLADLSPGAVLYYTLDGSKPTVNSSLYTAPLPVSTTTTITALAVTPEDPVGATSSATYVIGAAATAIPGFSPTPGPYATAQTVALSDATPGAIIYYTLDGSTPNSNSTQYTTPIAVAATGTINAFAVAAGTGASAMASGLYVIGPATVTAPESVDLAGVANLDGLAVSGTAVAGGGLDGHGDAYAANLFGATLTSRGDIYSLASAGAGSAIAATTIPLPEGSYATLNLLATGVNGNQRNQSLVVTYGDGSTATFTQSFSDWYTPQDYPGETTAISTAYRVVSTGATQPGPVYAYTYSLQLNPDETVVSLTLPANLNVAVLAVDLTPVGGSVSPPLTAVPVFSLAGGTYTAAVNVSLSDPTPGAVIYYTTDGTVPSTASAQWSAATPLALATTTTVNAFAAAAGYTTSGVTSATYTIATTPVTTGPTTGGNTTGAVPVSLASSADVTGLGVDGTPLAGGGIDGNGDTYSSVALGGSLNWSGATFNLGPAAGSDAATNTTLLLPAGSYGTLLLIATGVNGNQPNQTFVVTYGDGTTTTISQSLSDWFTPQNYTGESIASASPYRLNRAGQAQAGPFNVYGYAIALNPAKTVHSLTLPPNRNVAVLGVDLVPAPIFNLVGIGTDGTALAAGVAGLDGNGDTFSQVQLGSSLLWAGATFTFGPAGGADAAASITMPLAAGAYGSLSLLATGVNGNQPNQSFVVTYTDGTTTSITQSLSDWFTPQGYSGESVALASAYRLTSRGAAQAGPFNLYGYKFTLNAAKSVASLTLPANGNVVVLGVSLGAAVGGVGTVPAAAPPAVSAPATGAAAPPAPPAGSAAATSVGLLGTNNVYGIGAPGTPVGGGGIDGHDNAYADNFLGLQIAWSGETFTLETAGPGSAVTNTKIPLPPGNYGSLMLLGAGVNGNQPGQVFVVTYSDGGTASYTQSLSDWFAPMGYPGEALALATAYRITSTGNAGTGPFNVYGYSFALDSTKSPVSLTLPPNPNVVVLAVDLAP